MVKIIAEIGVNHNGDFELACKSILAAKNSGADVVKFQTWITDRLVKPGSETAQYQKSTTGELSQYKLLKNLELSQEQFVNLKNFCDVNKIEFLSTPDDFDSLDFLTSKLNIKTIKVGSAEVGNTLFLKQINKVADKIILSTGMSSLSDIEHSLIAIDADKTTLLHCTSNYPTPYNDVNLRAMQTLHQAFKTPVGYSDHTIGNQVSIAAVALGATIIEKHFTLGRELSGPDHKASSEPQEFKQLVEAIRSIEQSLGNGIKRPMDTEIHTRSVVTKRIFARRKLLKGSYIRVDDLDFLRAPFGTSVNDAEKFIGKKCKTQIEIGDPIYPSVIDD